MGLYRVVLDKNEERLYAYDRNRSNRSAPIGFASYTPAQVCYAKDLYRLKNQDIMERFDIDDDNVVEKSAFKLYENNLNKILTYSIERNRCFIALTEAKTLVKTLLNMKKRNPLFFQNINQQDIPRQTNENIKAEMLADKELWEVRLRSEGLSL